MVNDFFSYKEIVNQPKISFMSGADKKDYREGIGSFLQKIIEMTLWLKILVKFANCL
jgi:hypothetical protein